MRLWSLHPRYLDPQGLVALWREALLAKAALSAINAWLREIHAETSRRGYAFDRSKIGPLRSVRPFPVIGGQLAYEWRHLMRKLTQRSRPLHRQWLGTTQVKCHPSFRRIRGSIEPWERP